MARRFALLVLLTTAACGEGGASTDAGFDGPPEILDFRVSRSSVSPFEAVRLEWETKNARTVTVGSEDTTYVSSFEQSGSIDSPSLRATTTFILVAQAIDQTATSSLTVDVVWGPPVVEAFSIGVSNATIGFPVQVNWSARNTERIRIFINDTAIADRLGSIRSITASIQTFLLAEQNVFRMEAINPETTIVAERNVIAQPLPQIDLFTVSPRSHRGRTVTATVTWATSDAVRTELAANGIFREDFPGTTSGKYNFMLTQATDLVLTAFRENGAAQSQVFSIGIPYWEGEPNDSPGAAQNIDAPGAVRSAISSPDDTDVYAYMPGTGGPIHITVYGENGSGCDFDNRLNVWAIDESPLASALDGGAPAPGGGACARVELVELGSFAGRGIFIEVRSENRATGPYMLVVEED